MNSRGTKSHIIAAVAILIGIGFAGYFSLRPSGFMAFIRPFLVITEVVRRIGANMEDIAFSLARGGSKIAELHEENNGLKATLANYEYVQQENKLLHDALGRLGKDQSAVEGRVIGRSPTGTEDYIIVDIGSSDGIPDNALVLARGDAYIGKISERSGGISKVVLISDPGEKTQVYFPNSDVTSVAEGQGLGGITIKVPSSISLVAGDSIFYPGPYKDFYVGSIEQIEKSDEGAFQIIKTKIPFNVDDLRRVFILK
jgi:cell shape-determining protein MreC